MVFPDELFELAVSSDKWIGHLNPPREIIGRHLLLFFSSAVFL
jgi:hypothetical protein